MRTADQPDSNASSAAIEPIERPLVLVVDDDRITRGLVKRFLTKDDLEYVGMESAPEALKFLETQKADIILSDINMPDMDGIEFCKSVRKTQLLKDLPVIFFTGLQDMETMGRAFDAGANDYVVKPLRETEVISRTRRHIREYHRKREAACKIKSLNQQNETKNRILGVASHDLRNPIVSIRGLSQFLKSQQFGELNEGQSKIVDSIREASETMLSLVEDLLDISKIESNQISLDCAQLDARELAEQAITLHQPTAQRKDITLELVEHATGATIFADKKLVTRVIDNLMTNAIKFTYPETAVSIVLDAGEKQVTIAVEDEGPGIPKGEFDKLFKEFSRTSNLPTGGESSSGIGLFVSSQIMQSLGAEIHAENREKKGARFVMTFQRPE